MLTYVKGDLLTSAAQTLVNPVNTVGVMGKGLALQFRQRYPDMFRAYQSACRTGTLSVGHLWLYRTPQKWILNFPTKTDWRRPSDLGFIDQGLQDFVRIYADHGITSVAFPALGCGHGELNWSAVRPLMARYLGALPIDLLVYVPHVLPRVPRA